MKIDLNQKEIKAVRFEESSMIKLTIK